MSNHSTEAVPQKRLKTAENDTALTDNDKKVQQFYVRDLDIAHNKVHLNSMVVIRIVNALITAM